MDYKNYVYLKIPKNLWKKLKEQYKKNKDLKVDFEILLKGRVEYSNKQINKKEKALNSAKIKKANADIKIAYYLQEELNNIFSDIVKINELTPAKLAKNSGVSYKTAKRFWIEYSFDKWKDAIANNKSNFKKFLKEELAESIVFANSNIKKRIQI